MEQAYDYGMWVVVAINAALFIGFVSSYIAPMRRREWRSFGALTAFIIALFTEMYGFPLTIYLLSLYLGRLPFADPFAHASGNLWVSLFLTPEWSIVFMAFGFLPILVGGTLVTMGWERIHRSKGELVTDGVVKIEGTVVGTVRAGQQVLVAKGGIVEGDIHTREAVLGGEVRGTILAHERVEVQATSVVHGDIGTQRIVVHEGGEVNGHVKMGDPRGPAGQEEVDDVGAVSELARPPAAAHS